MTSINVIVYKKGGTAMNKNLKFDYNKEPSRDILCIDCKSFYASCEAVMRGLDPLTTKLVVMSYPSDSVNKRGSGLILASSPAAKKAYGITNVSRARDLPYPYPPDLKIASPRMKLYMEMHQKINNIYREFVDDSNIEVYSVDETFLDVTGSLRYFKCENAYEIARLIQTKIFKETGIYTTVGIGDNPLLAKLALDNEAKDNPDMKAEWRYEDVSTKVWGIEKLTDFWGIGQRTARRLQAKGIYTIYDLSQYNYYKLKSDMGVIGAQLYAHAWGIDRTFLGEDYEPKSKSIGNSQVLNRDYSDNNEIKIVIREMSDQVATRLRRAEKRTTEVGLWVGYSLGYLDSKGKTGFHKTIKVEETNSSKRIADAMVAIFDQHYEGQMVRNIGINCSSLKDYSYQQLNLFESISNVEKNENFDQAVDEIRSRFGFTKMVYTSSLVEGGRAIARSSLVGGHAGGLSGLENEGDKDEKKNR